jgi:hypothetical protein
VTAKECLIHCFVVESPDEVNNILNQMPQYEIENLMILLEYKAKEDLYLHLCAALSPIDSNDTFHDN